MSAQRKLTAVCSFKMNLLVNAFVILLFTFQLECGMKKNCKSLLNKTKYEYFPLRHCQRSNGTVIAFTDVETLVECADFARKVKGLAFNYSAQNRSSKNLFDLPKNESEPVDTKFQHEFHNCEVLACPEYRNFSSVINDTRYDYYTLYAYPVPNENATCIPTLGMFVFHPKPANYSTAFNNCLIDNGQLAHVASEKRTNEISKFLQHHAVGFVGLNESESHGNFITSNDEPLECFDFRAWALGHPIEIRSRPACVVLTGDASWKIYSCNKRAVYICELFTGGPNPYANNFNQTCSMKKPNNRFMPKKTSTGGSY